MIGFSFFLLIGIVVSLLVAFCSSLAAFTFLRVPAKPTVSPF